MNASKGHTRLRERMPLAPTPENLFRWRGNEVSRVEGFTDAVFAFAVTLLIVALEVPNTIAKLLDVVRGFPAFVFCFALLMTFWNAHYRYHRRYGMEDVFTRVTTMAILVLVLFFVYPLKFLFSMVTVNLFGIHLEDAPQVTTYADAQMLYLIYGLGLGGVWALYAALYGHAIRRRTQLGLSPAELMLTRASLAENLIYVGVCLLSITLAFSFNNDSIPGLIYILLGPLQAACGWWFGSRARKLAAAAA
jgi:uncharacterized membrane protein